MTGGPVAPETRGPLAEHHDLRERFEREAALYDRRATRLSYVQLALFGGAAVFAGSGLFSGSAPALLGGLALFALFLVSRALQSRVFARRDAARTRRDIHDRHLFRINGNWRSLPLVDDLIPSSHAYASDLDIAGEGSLLQRIDTTHTRGGARTLAAWLGSPAELDEVARRQEAVAELAPDLALRQELEAAVLDTGRDHVDAAPFLEQMGVRGLFEERPWLAWVAPALPALTLSLWALGRYAVAPSWTWLLPLAVQIAFVRSTEPRARALYESMGSKKGFVDGYARLLRVAEGMRPRAELLEALRGRLHGGGVSASVQLRRLDRWVGWFELRETGIMHLVLNPLLLWDLNCMAGIERWVREVGRGAGAWFDALSELEALASLSVLLHQDPMARLPEVVGDDAALEAEGLAHPLLPSDRRVANDVRLRGPGSALIVTGSNMAGKSTLLRAVGVNVALALAGGPVVAQRLRVPRVRLRASMRVADSLQSGASYFQAELARLRLVVERADEPPPILFLLDELLRGTNARARHLGARAVVRHLLDRGATGLVATHDVALSELEHERPGRVENVHFTDVIEDGEMKFDFRLRPGVVRTSNALRLLTEVGIEVEDEAVLTDSRGDSGGRPSLGPQ